MMKDSKVLENHMPNNQEFISIDKYDDGRYDIRRLKDKKILKKKVSSEFLAGWLLCYDSLKQIGLYD